MYTSYSYRPALHGRLLCSCGGIAGQKWVEKNDAVVILCSCPIEVAPTVILAYLACDFKCGH
jgi:hypothetical protein